MEDFNNELYSKRFDLIKKQKEEIDNLQKILSQKRLRNPNWKKSGKYKRLQKRLAKMHGKISNQRENLQHNITSELVKKEDIHTFIVEDLKIKNMTKRSPKGKSKVKRHLSRAILDVGMFSLVNKLTYKAEWEGKNVEKINAAYTSQRCSSCGHINKNSRISQAVFICVKCGEKQNADYNGAKNVKEKFFAKHNFNNDTNV